MSDKVVPPSAYIAGVVADVLTHEERLPGSSWIYEEKPGGFQCRSCRFAIPLPGADPKARCLIMLEPIHLDNGCCAAWMADPVAVPVASPPDDAAEFAGGCPNCGYGEEEAVQAGGFCPYCLVEVGV